MAVDAIEQRVCAPPSAVELRSLTQLDALSALSMRRSGPSEGAQLRAGLYILLHTEGGLPLKTYQRRDAWLKKLSETLVQFPLYKPDWPPRHQPLDLSVHDLPHASSLIEWWYFHAHLTSPHDGTPYCVFVALFQLKLGGETLSHVHASLLANGERHVYYTAGEPHAADVVTRHRHPKHDEYFERALLEVTAKRNLPLPDVVAPSRFNVRADRMDFDCHRMTMRKDEATGTYHVAVSPSVTTPTSATAAPATSGASSGADGFGFDLTFTPTKPAVRNGIDGVSPGVSSDDAMFYYSITRMGVEGTIYPAGSGAGPSGASSSSTDSASAAAGVSVSGEGWYDHEFGGDDARGGGANEGDECGGVVVDGNGTEGNGGGSNGAGSNGGGSNVAGSNGGGSNGAGSNGGGSNVGEKSGGKSVCSGGRGGRGGRGGGGGGGSIKVMDVQWCWTGVQLDDMTEVTYARTTDNLGKGTLVDKAVMIDKKGRASQADAELTQVGTWTSLETFIAYGNAWTLSVPSEGLELRLSAVVDSQELISVISTPAYWEGQVKVVGTRHGRPVAGNGFVEQYYGSQNQDFRTMLQAVSDVVLRNVESVFPYNPTTEHMVSLVVSKEFAPMMSGLPKDVFVKQLVTPVREITDRQGKGWRSMGLLLASSVVGGDPSKLERYTSFPEFLHTGSLIIDDIQDNSLLRRGGPCAHITHGVATAINAGTAAYFLGEGITRDHPNLTDQQRLRVYELYFTCLRGAHVGQAVDLNGVGHMMESCLSTNDFSPMWETLLCCHRLKSGLPASICARTGAVLGHASVEQEAALGEYFLSMGLAFQIIDDVINLRGFGKSLKTTAEDLIEGKITAPVIRCLMHLRGEPERQRWLWRQYALGQAERDIRGMVEMIEGSGAFESCIAEAHGMVESAWREVDRTVPDSFAKVCLRAFGWFVCKVRDY